MNHRTLSGVLVILGALSSRGMTQVPFDVPTLPSLPVIVDAVPPESPRPAPAYDPGQFNPNRMNAPAVVPNPGLAYPNPSAPIQGYGFPAYPKPPGSGYPTPNMPTMPYQNVGIPNQAMPYPSGPPAQPAPSVPYQPAPNVSYQPAPSVPYQPAPSVPYQPAPNASYQPAPNVSYQPVPNVPYQPVPNVPYQPAPGLPYQGMPTAGYPVNPNPLGGVHVGQDPSLFVPSQVYSSPVMPPAPNSGYAAQSYPSAVPGMPAYAQPVLQGPAIINQAPDQGGYIPAMPNVVPSGQSAPPPATESAPQAPPAPTSFARAGPNMNPGPLPRELYQSSHPPYTIAPPDILFIDTLRMIPRPPYRIEPLEVLLLNVSETLPNQPIVGPFTVSPDGFVSLGFGYGSVRVVGMTLEQAQEAIRRHLSSYLRNAQVSLALAQFRGMQQVRGQHLVRPDGTVGLGTFGSVYVAGMTLGQAKAVVERHLANYLLDPQVSIDVFAYNSKVYYVIIDGGGYGQQVFRLPITGNETVLDAIGKVQGLAPVSSKRKIWLARPSPGNLGYRQVMPVDWNAITQAGATDTNYQIFPGDRVYVHANCLIEVNNRLAQVLAPINQLLGVTFLGNTVAQSFRNPNGTGTALLVR